jgi:hypothetical protein
VPSSPGHAREPRILHNQDGVEVLKASRMDEEPLAKPFDDVDFIWLGWTGDPQGR